MQIKAKLSHLRIAPRKVRLITALIKRKKTEQAQAILKFTVKKGSEPLLKLLNSAIANAKNNFQVEIDNLYISKITVDEGRKLKRWMPRARGRATEIQKKTSHITLVLEEIKQDKDKKIKSKKIETKGKIVSTVPKKIEKKEEVKDMEKDIEIKENQNQGIKKQRSREEIKTTSKPKERGGIRRMFRRKSF